MDIKGLCKRLAQAEEEESVSAQGCSEYLLHQILRPLARGESILLKNVDFSRFDTEDVRILEGYYESLEMQGRKLKEVVGAIANVSPAACKGRRFC